MQILNLPGAFPPNFTQNAMSLIRCVCVYVARWAFYNFRKLCVECNFQVNRKFAKETGLDAFREKTVPVQHKLGRGSWEPIGVPEGSC